MAAALNSAASDHVSTSQPTNATLDVDDEKRELYEEPHVTDSNAHSDQQSLDGSDEPENAEASKVKTNESDKMSMNNIAAIPNGGMTAWLQVIGAWCLFFNTWGVLNTFGNYQTFYETGQLFHASSSTISWIGSVQSFTLLIVGAITGPIYDAGYFRTLLIVGSFLVVFGHMMLSLVHEFWQALLAQAFVIGIGAGCLFVPSVAILSTYFSTRIALAVGLAATGSSLGGVIYPIMFYKLQTEVGFGWTVRIIGFTALGLLAIPCTVMKMRVKPPAKRKLFNPAAFKEIPYSLFNFGAFLGFLGLYVPFFYVPFYAIQQRITDANLGFYLIPILNAASIFGRAIPNMLAVKYGPLNVMIPAGFVTAIIAFCFMASRSIASIIILSLLFGFFSGAFVSLPPAIYVGLTPPNKRHEIGTRMGMGFSCVAVGVLIGTPIGGAILGNDSGNYNWTGVWSYGGAFLITAMIFFVAARQTKAGGLTKVLFKI